MSPGKSRSGKKNNLQETKDFPLPPSCSVSNLTEFLADGNASFLRAARSGNLEKVIEYLKEKNIDINTSNANGLNALHLAAKEGHVNVVTELIKRGANVNAATKKGNTALHIASLAGQEEVVKVLVQLGANVNVQSQNGFTPLYMAAQENHDVVVSFLLANGANQSLATEDGFTPLAVALQQGHDKVVAVLLENDTKGKVRLPALHIAAKKDDCKAGTLLLQSDHNPDVTSKSGFTPLHIAAHYGNENIAKILLNKGADVNYGAKHQITPLHVASKWGKLNMVQLLLEKGAIIDASTRDGLTPLHCAARSGHDQVVDLLLEKGAPFLAKTKNGLAPLHMASQGDHVDSARILLYHKAPVDDVTVDYLTALHVAAHCGHVKVAKLLLDRKADPNARALNGFTPLHIACKKNRIKVVELLLKHGASIEATTESGLTPLHVASFMGCMNIVIYLIQNGSNPDVPTVRGETPLHLAARANQTDIIRILLRNGASVDARAREEQTPLHIAARLGNVDIVSLLLQHGAAVDAVTKDMYTALHITAKEDQEEVAAALLDHGASLTATTKKGFTPLHLASKYGNIKVARLLLQKGAPVDAQGKNGVTPLHVASHYDHVNVALLLLDKGASPHAMAKNGYTPLHIAAKKNQMDIASTLLEYGANTNAESKAGFTPLHLAAQEGHADMSSLLIENKANVNHKANNGLTPLHLCAQDDRVNVAQVLVKNGAEICPQTKAGYTPLHVASHFGQINMVRYLLQNDANVHTVTSHGYTPLHQAAQQGHTVVVNLLLENQASPNVTTAQGQTPLSIAQRLGYISVVETLKVVTETTVTTTTTTVTEEKYKVVAPETMQETFMTDSEDEGGEEAMLGDQSYRYLTADEMKSLGDDSLPIDVTKDEKQQEAVQAVKQFVAPMVEEDNISPQHVTPTVESGFSEKFSPDNIDLAKAPIHAGFLVSFMVDARGGAMRGCRHSGVRVIIPPRKASMPMRITCRYLRKEKLINPPPLMEGEACASRILEMGPVGARFLGPVIIEVPHFAATRGKEREITILRSDTGESWREHTLEASEEAVQDVLNESFEGEELSALEDLNTNRITRILTTDFPQYFAIVTRIRQEVHGVGPEGGMVSSTVVPQVQAIFPEGALTKKIRVGLQAQPIAPELVAKLLGNRVAVSPIVTVEPRRRKFHKPITLTIPVPQAATKGMINQYSGDAPTLRLLCSITGSTKSGGSSKAQWEDVTGSTPLTFVNDCVSFTTTVSARFWLMDCRQVNEVTRFATELYQEAVYVPFMSKFVIFAKRHDPFEAQLRVFCMTDDKEDKTLESQEHFIEVAKSRDVEVLEGKLQYLEFAGNLIPVTKSGDQLKLTFQAFHENRLPFTIRVKDPHAEPMGRIAFMKEPRAGRGEPPQTPICNLNVALPEIITAEGNVDILELVTLEKRYDFIQEAGLSKPELIHRADLRLSDIARELDKDWVLLAQQLDIPEQDIEQIKAQTVCDQSEQARMMLRLWLQKSGPKATGNELEKGLRKINREDIIKSCMFNVELVTDDVEKAVAKVHLDQSGFDVFKEELGSSREASMRRGASLDASCDEQDIMKEAESAAETSSETGSLFEKDQLSQALTDEKDEYAMPVHDTVLSVTDSSNNNNPPLTDDSHHNIKLLEDKIREEDITKKYQKLDFGEKNTLLLSHSVEKQHNFWPPGMIIQIPVADEQCHTSLISDHISLDKKIDNSCDVQNNLKSEIPPSNMSSKESWPPGWTFQIPDANNYHTSPISDNTNNGEKPAKSFEEIQYTVNSQSDTIPSNIIQSKESWPPGGTFQTPLTDNTHTSHISDNTYLDEKPAKSFDEEIQVANNSQSEISPSNIINSKESWPPGWTFQTPLTNNNHTSPISDNMFLDEEPAKSFDEQMQYTVYSQSEIPSSNILNSKEPWPPGWTFQTPVSDNYHKSPLSNNTLLDQMLARTFDEQNQYTDDVKSEISSDILNSEKSENYNVYPNEENANLEPDNKIYFQFTNDIKNQSENISFDDDSKRNGIHLPTYIEIEGSNKNMKFDNDFEYEASLEPDTENPDEIRSKKMSSMRDSKLDSKGITIVDVTSEDSGETMKCSENFFEQTPFFKPSNLSCHFSANNNKYPSLDADRNLFPIEESEKDESDMTEVLDSSSEILADESLNSLSDFQNKQNVLESKLKIESQDQFCNGSTEASDLGYFSLDKETNILNVSVMPENVKLSDSYISTAKNQEQKFDLNTSEIYDTQNNLKNRSSNDTEVTYDYFSTNEPSVQNKDALSAIQNNEKLFEESNSVKNKDNKLEGGLGIEKLREVSALLPEVKESEAEKPIETEFRKVEVHVAENIITPSAVPDFQGKLTESETWQSGDLDTSQVSVSSLPEDDKSEHTTTVSSTAAVIIDTIKKAVPDTEITDVDKSGTTTHIIQKTTHMTLITHTKPDDGSLEESGQPVTELSHKVDKSLSSEELKTRLSEIENTTKKEESSERGKDITTDSVIHDDSKADIKDSSEKLVQKVTGDTVITKTVISSLSRDSSEKAVMPESSTSTAISLETEDKATDSNNETTSMPK